MEVRGWLTEEGPTGTGAARGAARGVVRGAARGAVRGTVRGVGTHQACGGLEGGGGGEVEVDLLLISRDLPQPRRILLRQPTHVRSRHHGWTRRQADAVRGVGGVGGGTRRRRWRVGSRLQRRGGWILGRAARAGAVQSAHHGRRRRWRLLHHPLGRRRPRQCGTQPEAAWRGLWRRGRRRGGGLDLLAASEWHPVIEGAAQRGGEPARAGAWVQTQRVRRRREGVPGTHNKTRTARGARREAHGATARREAHGARRTARGARREAHGAARCGRLTQSHAASGSESGRGDGGARRGASGGVRATADPWLRAARRPLRGRWRGRWRGRGGG